VNHDLEHIRAVACDIARAAGELLLEHLGQIRREDVRTKSAERDLVTRADVGSERLIVERLRSAFPQHAIEAEEEVCDEEQVGGLRWFVDPLDGTVNFVHQLPCFAVSLALFEAGRPLVGVVYAPRLDELFAAHAGGGATLNGRPISVSTTTQLGDAILATGFPYRRGELEHSNLENFGRFFYDVRGLRRMGSAAYDLACVAAGRMDGFWELHLSPHDVAAGALLVREAGGEVSDGAGGEQWLRSGHIVAAGPELAAAIRARLEF